jgi:hypothetical protein
MIDRVNFKMLSVLFSMGSLDCWYSWFHDASPLIGPVLEDL